MDPFRAISSQSLRWLKFGVWTVGKMYRLLSAAELRYLAGTLDLVPPGACCASIWAPRRRWRRLIEWTMARLISTEIRRTQKTAPSRPRSGPVLASFGTRFWPHLDLITDSFGPHHGLIWASSGPHSSLISASLLLLLFAHDSDAHFPFRFQTKKQFSSPFSWPVFS